MKEQWKKLDSDAKLLLNVEEGRSLPIKIELPLSAFSQNKDDCCKRLLITLRVFVLLALLVLLSWTAMTLYTNYRVKSSVVIQDDEIPTYFNEANKMAFKNKIWEEDVKSAAINDFSVSEKVQEKTRKKLISLQSENIPTDYKFEPPKVDSSFKPVSNSAESNQESVGELLQDLQNIVEKIEKEKEVSENNLKVDVDLTKPEDPKEQNEEEAVSFLSFLDSLVDPILLSQLDKSLQQSAEKIEEETSDDIVKDGTNLSKLQKDENDDNDSESLPIQNWLDILRVENMFINNDQNNWQRFSEDSEEASKENIDKILMQTAKANQDALDQFLIEVVERFAKTENDLFAAQVSGESVEQSKQSENEMSANSQSNLENKSLFDSEENPENNFQKSASEETSDSKTTDSNHSSEEFSASLSDLKIFEISTVIPVVDESTNQSSEELNKVDENDVQSTEIPSRGIVLKDIYLLMARRLEAMLGEYDDLLIWYFKNRNEKEPLDDASQLKYFTTRLLFGKDITEFRKYSIFVLSFLTNDDYIKDFGILVDHSQPKLQPTTETEAQIVNRLVTKSHMNDLYNQGDENAEEIADAIESINLLELKLSGVDVDTFLNSLEENKPTDESVNEDSVEEIDYETEKRHQAIIEAMRRVAHFEESSIDDSKHDNSKESKEDNTSTESLAGTSIQESSEEANNRRQAFIQALQHIADISESKESNDEVDKNSDQSIKEDEEESSPETISKDSEEPTIEEVKSDSHEVLVHESEEDPELSIHESSEESDNRRQAFIQALQRIADIAEVEKSSEETETNQSTNEDEKEASLQTVSKESKEIPSWKPVQSISEEEPIVEEIRSNEQSDVDVSDYELKRRLHSLMEDVLSSKDEPEESVNMNDLLTIYDGFDY